MELELKNGDYTADGVGACGESGAGRPFCKGFFST